MTTPLSSGAKSVAADVYLFVKTKRAGHVKGEVTAKGHEADIAIDRFSFGLAASSALGSGQATARRQYEPLVVHKRLDSATTSLMAALATNDEIVTARLSLRKAGDPEDFFTINLAKARVASVDLDCDDQGNAVERIALMFAEIEVAYRVQTATGLAGATSTFTDDWFGG